MKNLPSPLSSSDTGRSSRRRQRGFTLIEVMVALVVLVLGVLGAAAMTLTALRDTKQSGLRSQASAMAYEMIDLIRANRYGLAPTVPPAAPLTGPPYQEAVFVAAPPASGIPACWSSSCTPTQMATNDYYEWNQRLIGPGGLPNGQAKICRDVANLTLNNAGYANCDNLATSPLVVKMKWDEKINYARGQTGTSSVTTSYLFLTVQPY